MKSLTRRWLILVCLIASSILLSFMNSTQAAEPYAGKYELVSPPQPTTTQGKIEVVELFWYSCPHCKHIDDYVKPWLKKKPTYVEFKYMPAVFAMSEKPNWRQRAYHERQVLHAKAYYIAEVLGILDKLHEPIFDAVQDKKNPIASNKGAFQKLFAEHGVSKAIFEEKFDLDFTVDSGVRTSETMTGNYGIGGVPVIIVHGKYRVTVGKADGYENMLKIIEYLAAKEYKLMKSGK